MAIATIFHSDRDLCGTVRRNGVESMGLRPLDDTLVLWKHGEEQPDVFRVHLNSMHENIAVQPLFVAMDSCVMHYLRRICDERHMHRASREERKEYQRNGTVYQLQIARIDHHRQIRHVGAVKPYCALRVRAELANDVDESSITSVRIVVDHSHRTTSTTKSGGRYFVSCL
ncbi:unnamed protein product [Soboliphyme baturini]|uniref:Helitron helicase n=1 Tax=Soboliphyme baturini TaxID=241478 RepID=A0A183IHC8_9BILA|nr:unnamed protein product [Soboliphyme baturini]